MTQTARPTAEDISTGLWTPTPIYAQINGLSGGPGFVKSSDNPQVDTFEVPLTGVAFPGPGPQTLNVSLKGDPSLSGWFSLIQSGAPIAMRVIDSLSDGYVNYFLQLTDSQAGQITDYTKLSVRVSVSGKISVSCCPHPIPPVLKATVASLSGCDSMFSSYVLTYDQFFCGVPGPCWTTRNVPCSGHPTNIIISVACISGNWKLLSWDAAGGIYPPYPDPVATCDPFSLVWNSLSVAECCMGSVSLTITP